MTTRIFISSLISGMEAVRDAARQAVLDLGFEPVMAEDFEAQPNTPQVACLTGLRTADAVLLLLGDRYGEVQPSGRSATHEEFEEARDRKPVIPLLMKANHREPSQSAFIEEVGRWETGLFRNEFQAPEELRSLAVRALHRWHAGASAPTVDDEALLQIAVGALPATTRGGFVDYKRALVISIAGAPRQAILRPRQMEEPALAEQFLQAALFGEHRIFSSTHGTQTKIVHEHLLITQPDIKASVKVGEDGSVVITQQLGDGKNSMIVLEEDVTEALLKGLGYADLILEKIDATQRLSRIAIAVLITGGENANWRTRQEHRGHEGSYSMFTAQLSAAHLSPPARPRAALRFERQEIAEDLMIRLRRQFNSEHR
ncbi:DUF4062 domain-containing protein [Luteibacter sp. UNCMF366Tsu5.1]|uniref:DUF4062 domain-containing protein n=1 Tax=Luteibacter sp. UNCMF366Tsu5.1 TaxID=1502758 RepID=UPI0009088C00|nr:DUF4062 domain-containing protein [Luteibacter sp. UNCMF366Tsu5.1]SFW74545.1 protein of unknown function [Luteibacter sp. UNCMF366Tsu5.1]